MHLLWIFVFLVSLPAASWAQNAAIAFGTPSFDVSLPVEASADSLSVDQGSGAALFQGNVLVVQGDIRMSASEMEIIYADDKSGIKELRARGGVTFVTATDAVEAAEAVYSVAQGTVTLTGGVLLPQGQSAISGDRLVVNLEGGTGTMEGRVRTVIGGGN